MPRLKTLATILACTGLAVAVPATAATVAARATPAPSPTGAASLPARTGMPWMWTPTVQDAPAGSAALLFGGDRPPMVGLLSEEESFAAVGADRDTYRLFNAGEFVGGAGYGVLLSGDGSRVAYGQAALDPETAGIRLLDLRTGKVEVVRSPDPAVESFNPEAWSPDGRWMAVRRLKGTDEELGVVGLDGGGYHRLGSQPTERATLPVAFTQDGTRVAFQVGDQVTISRVAGAVERTLKVPAGAVLAGKGAWLPDGRSLALVSGDGNTWRVRLLDIAGGQVTDADLPPVPDVTTIRVLGWRTGGEAWAVAYLERDGTDHLQDDPFDAGRVRGTRVVSLTPGATATKTLLSPPGANSVDVAAAAITAAPRAGADAPVLPIRPRWAGGAALAGYLLLLGLVLVVRVAVRRR
jgi:hypothetical protein